MKPKELRKISDGRIFAYTEELAQQPGIVPHWGDGERPESLEEASGGLLMNDETLDSKVKRTLETNNKTILALEKDLDAVVVENQELRAEIEALKAGSGEAKKELSPKDRMAALVAATKKILKKDDSNDVTSAGLPRMESLASVSGIEDATADERNEAYRTAKKK